MSAALYGADHEGLDVIVDAPVDDATAIALSRGRFPKGYGHVDANEDALLAAVGEAGTLLAVADGHNGVEASHAAISAIAGLVKTLLAEENDPFAAVDECFAAARSGIAESLRRAAEERRRSRTALTVALLSGGRLYSATSGDTAVAVVRGRRAKVGSGTGPFLGPHTPLPEVMRTKLKHGDIVVAVTDGVTDFLGSQWTTTLAAVVGEADSARAAAVSLVYQAMAGGAGDNIAAAVTDA
jgi:serine/threonine protein phosphatase PrpC